MWCGGGGGADDVGMVVRWSSGSTVMFMHAFFVVFRLDFLPLSNMYNSSGLVYV